MFLFIWGPHIYGPLPVRWPYPPVKPKVAPELPLWPHFCAALGLGPDEPGKVGGSKNDPKSTDFVTFCGGSKEGKNIKNGAILAQFWAARPQREAIKGKRLRRFSSQNVPKPSLFMMVGAIEVETRTNII